MFVIYFLRRAELILIVVDRLWTFFLVTNVVMETEKMFVKAPSGLLIRQACIRHEHCGVTEGSVVYTVLDIHVWIGVNIYGAESATRAPYAFTPTSRKKYVCLHVSLLAQSNDCICVEGGILTHCPTVTF